MQDAESRPEPTNRVTTVNSSKSHKWRYYFLGLWILNVWCISTLLILVLVGNEIDKLNTPGAALGIGLTFLLLWQGAIMPIVIIDIVSILLYIVARFLERVIK
jgi:hypothetical protein